jgi:hypothetical protein
MMVAGTILDSSLAYLALVGVAVLALAKTHNNQIKNRNETKEKGNSLI